MRTKMTEVRGDEIEELRQRLEEAEETLRAIRHGEIDALVVAGADGNQIYTLKGAESTYRVLIESMNEGAVTFTTEGMIVYCNKSFAGLLNRPLGQVIGSAISAYIPAKEERAFTALLARAERSKTSQKELHLMAATASLPALCSVTMQQLDDEQAGFSMIVTDLREAKRVEETVAMVRLTAQQLKREQELRAKIEESEERFRLLVEGAKDFAMILLDPTGKVKSWNTGAENLLGYSETEILGQDFSVFYTAEDRRAGLPSIELQTAIQAGRAEDENWLVRKDRSRFWASGMSMGVYDQQGQLKGIAKIARDTTIRRELERQKDDFIGVASHELKTPVTSIKGYAQVLRQRLAKEGHLQAAQYLDKMDGQLNKLTSLIGDLLDVTKIESGKLQFHETEFDFDGLVDEVVEELQRTTNRHQIVQRGKTASTVRADRDRLGQVLTNLLSNAIKYSPHAGEIVVDGSSSSDDLTLCVQDFGVGIRQDKQAQVFERFFRVSGPEQDTFPGLGLGLYISAEIIQRQGGRIWMESTEGQGSTFCFTLPKDA